MTPVPVDTAATLKDVWVAASALSTLRMLETKGGSVKGGMCVESETRGDELQMKVPDTKGQGKKPVVDAAAADDAVLLLQIEAGRVP